MTGRLSDYSIPRSLEDLKAQAKRLRAALAQDGDFISHSEALELLAKQLGFRDWNTLHAAAGNRPPPPQIGDRVAGAYLGQRFEGEIIAVSALSGGRYRVTIDFATKRSMLFRSRASRRFESALRP
ncbi:MAG: glyoxalase superfamily protein [Parvularculaceae bacterium]